LFDRRAKRSIIELPMQNGEPQTMTARMFDGRWFARAAL